ncbi:MAG: hypothetical protein U9R19_12970 [Bacteroidota bacterium]|nr:hypothetical protein [Bacteroidota bacterium]
MKNPVITIILLTIALKIFYLVFSFSIRTVWFENDEKLLDYNTVVSAFKKNDSWWYEKISVNGYPKITNKKDIGYSNGPEFTQSSWAFFPLYPALNRGLSILSGKTFNLTALIWSLVFSLASFIGSFYFARAQGKTKEKSLFMTTVFMLFPFHYYYSMFYTEAVYFTFLIYSFLAIHYKKIWLVPILIIPLVLVRPNGIVVLLPLLIYYLEAIGIVKKYKIDWPLLFSKNLLKPVLIFISGPIAFIIYGFYQQKMTGEFLAFSIAQQGWYREFMFPLFSFFRRGDFATQFNSVYTIIIILFAFLISKRFSFSLNVFIWVSLILPLCSGSVGSMHRFIIVIFPFYLFLGERIFASKIRPGWIALLIILHFTTYLTWVTGHPLSC